MRAVGFGSSSSPAIVVMNIHECDSDEGMDKLALLSSPLVATGATVVAAVRIVSCQAKVATDTTPATAAVPLLGRQIEDISRVWLGGFCRSSENTAHQHQ